MSRIRALLAALWNCGFDKSISAAPVKYHLLFDKCVHPDDTHVVQEASCNGANNTPGGQTGDSLDGRHRKNVSL